MIAVAILLASVVAPPGAIPFEEGDIIATAPFPSELERSCAGGVDMHVTLTLVPEGKVMAANVDPIPCGGTFDRDFVDWLKALPPSAYRGVAAPTDFDFQIRVRASPS